MAENIGARSDSQITARNKSSVMLVGTSHVAEESLKLVTEAVEKFKPDVIAIELDKGRVDALHSNKKASFGQIWRHAGMFAALFYTVGRILQEKIGDSLGIKPGSEMIHSISIAKSKNIPIALVDRDIRVTLVRLKKIPNKEKWRFFFDLFTGKMAKDSRMQSLDLKKVPSDEIVSIVLDIMKKRYPSFYSVLVHERNEVMVANVKRLSQHYERILVVVGKGHAPGMKEIFERMKQS